MNDVLKLSEICMNCYNIESEIRMVPHIKKIKRKYKKDMFIYEVLNSMLDTAGTGHNEEFASYSGSLYDYLMERRN